jgi:hypothetical protein
VRLKKTAQQYCDRIDAILAQAETRVFQIGLVAQRLALHSVLIDPDEMQVVGKNDVLRQALVAGELVGFQNLVEFFADGLVLDVAENEGGFADFEVGRTFSYDALRFVNDADAVLNAIGDRLQKVLERSAVSVFGLLVKWRPAEIEQVAIKDLAGRHLRAPAG